MKGIYAIYRKEMSHYFVSPIAYIIGGVFLLLTGFFFTRVLGSVIEQAFEAGMQSMQFGGGGGSYDVPSLTIRYFFGVLSSILLFLTPMLTMGVYAEERKRGTIELLMTSPITDAQIVLGKFFASLSLLIILLVPTMAYSVFMYLHSDPAAPWRILFCAYFGVLLLGGSLLALGSLFSSLTENQIIAAVLTFGVFLILWVIEFGSRNTSTGIGAVVSYLSVVKHYDDFTRGILDSGNVVFYLSLILLSIFLTIRSLDSMRWRARREIPAPVKAQRFQGGAPKMISDRQEWLRNIATIGIAMAVAGAIRYEYQGELLLTSKILLIGGGVLILAALVLGYQSIINFFSRPSARVGTNAFTLIISVVAILGFLNFLSFRHHKRIDLTTEKLFSLSDQTKKVVGGLKQDVDIYWFDKSPNATLSDQIAEYRNLSPHVHFKEVDPQQHPETAQQFGITRMSQGAIASGTKHQLLDGTTEQDITNAIVKVTRNVVKTVCFVEGHGERSITGSDADGYAGAAALLKQESYETKSINLVTSNGVPSDCTEVVIAGPKQAFLPVEEQILSKYLDDGGKAFILVDPQTDPKLDDIFNTWNVKVGDNVIVDASALSQMAQMGPFVPIVVTYGASPITERFGTGMTLFPEARTVSVIDKNKSQPGSTELLKTSTRSFTIPKLDPNVKEIKYDASKDTLGPLSLGVASERKGTGDASLKDARVVVIGNSQFASNQWGGQVRNADLFMNSVNWLAADEDLISIRPKSATSRRVTFTETQQRELNWFSLLFLPGIVVLSGVYIWWKRR